ncbi:MAG: NUDIX hydrolase [Longimicrobiales bacterium]
MILGDSRHPPRVGGSDLGQQWGWPGGRPEGNESWEQTLRREVLEEACVIVRDARLLGFCRAACVSGPEKGVVLVRSIWRANVEVLPWAPRYEIRHRRLVPLPELDTRLVQLQEFRLSLQGYLAQWS